MLASLNDRLTQAKERLRAKQKLESMLRQAQSVVRAEKRNAPKLKDKLAKEQADMDQLAGLSMSGLFYSVLGTKDERLEKERQEFLAAKLKYEESVASLESAEQEVQRLDKELAPLAGADAEYRGLIEEKERLLAETGDDNAKKLLDIAEQVADLNSDRKELEEAAEAGKTVLRSLRRVKSELKSAANWGTWDMFGGGMISTMAKHSKIDSAKKEARQAQRHLRRFQEELADADQRLQVSLEIGGFAKFADFFFDGLIADWVVQSKISNASSACESAITQVTTATNACRRRLAETEQAIDELDRLKNDIIEQA